jgi:hypothetical protein
MQFGSDWPGIFIRGDEALHYVSIIALALAELAKRDPASAKPLPTMADFHKHALYGLGKLLASCSAGDTGWPPRRLVNVVENEGDHEAIKGLPPPDGGEGV